MCAGMLPQIFYKRTNRDISLDWITVLNTFKVTDINIMDTIHHALPWVFYHNGFKKRYKLTSFENY